MGSLKGATVLITGSSMGLGEQFAYQFAANGARIILTARSENKLIKVASACRKLGADEVHYFLTDMQDANQINTLIEVNFSNFCVTLCTKVSKSFISFIILYNSL